MKTNQQNLEEEVQQLRNRVAALENSVYGETTTSEPEESQEAQREPEHLTREPRRTPSTDDESRTSFDPGTVLAWAGGLIFSIGLLFLVSYAYQEGWISEPMQILLGVLFGAALTWFGDYLYRKQGITGTLVSAAGIAATYFTLYIAYAVETYRVATGLSLVATIALQIAVLLTAGWLAFRHDQSALLILTYILAYISVFLAPFTYISVAYLAAVTTATLIYAHREEWVTTAYLTAILTIVFLFTYTPQANTAELLTATLILGALHFTHAAYHRNQYIAPIAFAGTYTFAATLLVTEGIPVSTLTLSFAAAAILTYATSKQAPPELTGFIGVSAALLAIYVATEFNANVVTASWALLATGLATTGIKENKKAILFPGLVLLGAVLIRGAIFQGAETEGTVRIVALLITAAAPLTTAYVAYRNHRETLSQALLLPTAIPILVLAFTELGTPENAVLLLAVAALTALIPYTATPRTFPHILASATYIAAYTQIPTLATGENVALHAVLAALLFLNAADARAHKELWKHIYYNTGILAVIAGTMLNYEGIIVTLTLGVIGILALLFGKHCEEKSQVLTAYFVLTISILKLFLIDTTALSDELRIIAYVVLGVLLLGGSIFYAKNQAE